MNQDDWNRDFTGWNIDHAVKLLENGESIPGTSISRVMMDHALFEQNGLLLSDAANANDPYRQSSLVWCLAVGKMSMPKQFFYGITIYEAFKNAFDKNGK